MRTGMALDMVSVFFAIVISIIATCAWKAVEWAWWRPKKLEKCLRQQGLSGNPYRPLHGDLNETSLMEREAISRPIGLHDDTVPRVLPFLHHSIKKYGKNFFTWIGPTPRVNIMDPKMIREILSNHNIFKRPTFHPFGKLLVGGILATEGEQWAKRRKIMNPAFHSEKLKNMLSAFHLSCEEITKQWEELAMRRGSSCEVDVWPYFQSLTGDVISRTAFGSSYKEGRRIFQLQKEQAHLLRLLSQSAYIPGWRFLPTKTNRRMKEISNEVRSTIKGIIAKRVEAMERGEATNDDLLGILLESNQMEIWEHKDKKMGMTVNDMIDECKLFYLAGQITTAIFLMWTMVLLSKHQTWQERAREEVFEVFGQNKPEFDGLSRLKVVSMIFNEVLRLYPSAIEIVRVTTAKETKLGELTLPEGVQLSLPTFLVHHDPEIWGDDANEFKPERFSEGISKASKTHPAPFIPFSYGPRICIGQNFALIEAKIALTMILQRFSFELSPSYAHAPCRSFGLQPQYGAHIILHKI